MKLKENEKVSILSIGAIIISILAIIISLANFYFDYLRTSHSSRGLITDIKPASNLALETYSANHKINMPGIDQNDIFANLILINNGNEPIVITKLWTAVLYQGDSKSCPDPRFLTYENELRMSWSLVSHFVKDREISRSEVLVVNGKETIHQNLVLGTGFYIQNEIKRSDSLKSVFHRDIEFCCYLKLDAIGPNGEKYEVKTKFTDLDVEQDGNEIWISSYDWEETPFLVTD